MIATAGSPPRATSPKVPARALVAIVASAGGIEAIASILAGLPADLPASPVLVLTVHAAA